MLITFLSLAATIFAMTGSLLLAIGRLRVVFLLGMVTGSCYALLDLLLALREGQAAVAWLIIPSLWGVLMHYLGLRRLRRNDGRRDNTGRPSGQTL